MNEMNAPDNIDTIVDNLFYAVPVLHQKLMNMTPPNIRCGLRLSRRHIGIMAMLKDHHSPISDIANAFFISNPQMTYLIDQMASAGLVDRATNSQDRRVKDIKLTAKGEDIFLQCDRYLKNNARKMLSDLSHKDLSELAVSLARIKEIGPRL